MKSELKHVDEEASTYLQLERISQLVQFSNISNVENSTEEESVSENISSKNIVVNLMPAPIKPFPAGSENKDSSSAVKLEKAEQQKIVDPKPGAPARKKPSQSKSVAAVTNEIKPALAKEKAGPPKPVKSGQKETLQSPNLIQQVKSAQNGADKEAGLQGNGSLETPSLLKEVSGAPRRASSQSLASKTAPEKRLSSPCLAGLPAARRHVPRPRPLSSMERRSKSPDQINIEMNAKQKDYMQDIKKADPSLVAAQEALSTLNKVQISYVKR